MYSCMTMQSLPLDMLCIFVMFNVIKFVCYLRSVAFIRYSVPSTNKTDRHEITEIFLEKVLDIHHHLFEDFPRIQCICSSSIGGFNPLNKLNPTLFVEVSIPCSECEWYDNFDIMIRI